MCYRPDGSVLACGAEAEVLSDDVDSGLVDFTDDGTSIEGLTFVRRYETIPILLLRYYNVLSPIKLQAPFTTRKLRRLEDDQRGSPLPSLWQVGRAGPRRFPQILIHVVSRVCRGQHPGRL